MRVVTPSLVLALPCEGCFSDTVDRRAGERRGGEDDFVAEGVLRAGVSAFVADAKGWLLGW